MAKVILPKDYLRLKLTGELANDMSDAAGTLWLDPAKRDWDDTLLAATGLSRPHAAPRRGQRCVWHPAARRRRCLGLAHQRRRRRRCR